MTAQQVVILTRREREVAALVAQGKTNQQIADDLGIAGHTVANHIVAIRRQVRVDTRTQLAVWVLTGSRPEVSNGHA